MYGTKGLFILAFAVFLLLLIPVFSLIAGTSFFPQLGRSSFSLWSFLTAANTSILVSNTLEFSIISAAITTALATTFAWFVARTDVPGKRFLELLPVLGLTIPAVFKALAWNFLFNPNSGVANQMLRVGLGPGAPVLNVNTMAGLITVQSLTNVPIVYLITLAAMKSIDPSLEEASRVSGRGAFQTFARVTLPVIRPAAFSAFVLAVIGGINNFDYTFIIGIPSGLHFLATEIYYYTSQRAIPAYGSAGIISVLYVTITLITVAIYIWSTRRAFKFQVVTGRSSAGHAQRLGSFRYLGFLFCLAVLFFEFIMPFLALFLISTTDIFSAGITGMHAIFPYYYLQALKIPSLFQSLRVTFTFGLIAALLATAAGALLSYTALRSGSTGARLTEYVSAVPLAFPGVVYGVALFWTFLLVPGMNLLYGTIWPLVISLVFLRLPFSTRIISGNLVQISNEMEEASQVAGAGFGRTFVKVTLPLIKEGVFNSFIYTFVDSIRELGGVIILVTSQTVTFTALLLGYWNAPNTAFSTVAAAAVIFSGMISLILFAAAVARHFLERRGSPRP